MRETKGEAVSATEWLNNLFNCLQDGTAAQSRQKAAEENVLGSIMRTAMETNHRAERLE